MSDLLDDLDDLGSDSEDELDAPSSSSRSVEQGESAAADDDHMDDGEDDDSGEDGNGVGEDPLDTNSLLHLVRQKRRKVSLQKLREKSSYVDHMANIKAAAADPTSMNVLSYTVLEDSPDYKLVVSSQQLVTDIEEEKDNNIMRVAELYTTRFPELEQLIPNKLAYIQAVQRIGNEMDVNSIRLDDIMTNITTMIINVAAASTQGTPLVEHVLTECMSLCSDTLRLEEDKVCILQFLESRMPTIAPNLCTLIGSHVAARLLALTGGLKALSTIPSCNIASIGLDHRNLNGMSTASNKNHAGPLGMVDFVIACPQGYRKKLLKILTGKVTLAARIDTSCDRRDVKACTQGEIYKSDLLAKVDVWKKPDKARTKKALPIPALKARAKRGGKRVRKSKERNSQTELAKLGNRMSFTGSADGEYGDSAMGFDSGMIGHKDVGRMRAIVETKRDVGLSKKQKKALEKDQKQTEMSGLSTSLAFTPVQGIALVNPKAAAEKVAAANSKWFSDVGFSSNK